MMTKTNGTRYYAMRNRETGTETWAGEAAAQGIDDTEGRWAAVCWTHGAILNVPVLATAVWAASHPTEFCEDCRTIIDGEG